MPYYNIVVTCIADCVVEASSEEEALEYASYLDTGDAKIDEIESKGLIKTVDLEAYKRFADYISEDK